MRLLAALIWVQVVCLAQAPSGSTPTLKPGLYAIFNTSKGTIIASLYEKYTPLAVQTFIGLAQGTKAWRDPKTHAMVRRPLYNGITFHRVIRGAMIQSGDPTATSAHDCGFTVRDEFLPGLRFDRGGKLAVANTGQPDSGGCQFFITAGPMPEWNNHYTIFGEVVSGEDVVRTINEAPGHGDKPVDPAKLFSVTIERIGGGPGKKGKNK
jgi:cyclophilin family peptidyl-prolyl cis-trans isomerase